MKVKPPVLVAVSPQTRSWVSKLGSDKIGMVRFGGGRAPLPPSALQRNFWKGRTILKSPAAMTIFWEREYQ